MNSARRPWRAAAPSTLSMPRTLDSSVSSGLSTTSCTPTAEARCRTVSDSRTRSSTSAASVASPRRTSRGLGQRCSTLHRRPVLRLSSRSTSWPRAVSASLRCEPTKPAPPVMRYLTLPPRSARARRPRPCVPAPRAARPSARSRGLPGGVDRRLRVADLSGPRRRVDRRDAGAHDVAQLAGQLVERDPVVAGDVEHVARQRSAARARREVRLDDVVDVGEVARLLAVAEDQRRLAAQRGGMKRGITAAYCDCGSWRGPKTLK